MQRAREEVPWDRGPPRLRERRVVWRVQRLEREGQVLQLVLWRVRRIPCSLVAEEVLSNPPHSVPGFSSATAESGWLRSRSGVHVPARIRAMTTACYCDWGSLDSRDGVPKDGTPTGPGFSSAYSRVS